MCGAMAEALLASGSRPAFERVASLLDVFTACAPIYSAAMAQGLAQSDTASVHEVLAVMAGNRRRARSA